MDENEALHELILAIETIQANWAKGDLANAVRDAVSTKDEICQRFNITVFLPTA